MEANLHNERKDYLKGSLLEDDLESHPLAQFAGWFEEYRSYAAHELNAVVFATESAQDGPNARMVLLKEFDASGFVIYTNLESAKASEARERGRAALLFFWPEMQRQVKIRVRVEWVGEAENDAYFASRPFESQVGAWASHQSRELGSREQLESRFEELMAWYAGKNVPRPESWGGIRLVPERYEFWQGRPSRLHDRIEYISGEMGWSYRRLYP